LAKREPDKFIEFAQKNESSGVASVHRLLAIGLSQIGATHARFGLEYLLGDARRLQLENFHEDERETNADPRDHATSFYRRMRPP